jgi:Zn-dependent peptidase ImmA (M78 family)
MSTGRPRYSLAERKATDLLSHAGLTQPPVPVEDLIRAQGIELRFPDLGGDVSGVLVRQSEGMVIGVNRRHAKTRQRFTAAHELGHALLHRGAAVHHDAVFRVNLRSDLSSQGVDAEEVEANHFAASLLMPRAFLEADPGAFLCEAEDPASLNLLVRRYGVSTHAMALRLTTLARFKR